MDAITESARQAAESAVQNLDLNAIRENAQRAAESARVFVSPFPGAGPWAFAPFQGWSGRGQEPQAEALYNNARNQIDHGRYERALEQLDRLVGITGNGRVDAALYWKAYAQAKLGRRAEALATLADLQKRFAESRWLKDAKALEVEVRQASGQSVSPDAQSDEELKLLALRGIMQTEPDRALPMLERLLAGNGSVRLQENALFVLAQSPSPRAREIIVGIAKGSGNPDVQLRAVRYLGVMSSADNRAVLDEVYRSSNDGSIRRAILQSFMTAGDRPRLLAAAKNETSAELRATAIQQLGNLHATAELSQLYQTESSPELKKKILEAMFIGGDAEKLIELARTERDRELRRTAVRNLGLLGADKTGEALRSMYVSDAAGDVRPDVVNALFVQHNVSILIALARAEKNPALKKDIVSKLSLMKSKEATDYLLELLK